MSTTTPNKGYVLQSTGENPNSWGGQLNTNVMGILDLNLGGRLSTSVAGSSDVTVSTTNARYLQHKLTGVLTGNISYILPNTGGFYIIQNATTGSFTVTVKPSGGTGIVVTQGYTSVLFMNPDSGAAEAWLTMLPSLKISGNLVVDGTSTLTGNTTVTGTLTSGAHTLPSTTFNSNTGLVGLTLGTAAPAGSVGEYISATASGQAYPASGTWGDAATIALNAGEWSLNLMGVEYNNGATVTAITMGVGTASGTSAADLVLGDNSVEIAPSTTAKPGYAIPDYRVLLSGTGTSTYRAKMQCSYTGTATPVCTLRLSARRVR